MSKRFFFCIPIDINDKINRKWYFWFMLEGFIRHIREKNILDVKAHYLLAISGGLDSVVLAHLLYRSGIPFSMAHCNFGLRGEESDGDERFVQQLAGRLGTEVFMKRFDTKAYGAEKGISTQMAARHLRYEWFNQLLVEQDLSGIVVAHHADDQLETVMLNLLRGTGIEGIYGMSESRERILRPLLPFNRTDIAAFAAAEGIDWREDSSNSSIDYKRNFIRHRVMPRLAESDPSALSLLQNSFDRIKDNGKAFFYLYDCWLEQNIKKEGEFQYLDVGVLENVPGKKTLLFYWLRAYGFNYSQMNDILSALDKKESGKIFHSEEHSLNLDRIHLIMGSYQEEFEEGWIEASSIEMQIGSDAYDILVVDQPETPPRSSSEAMLDKGKLSFPLKIRSWEQGDRFRPLGMKNFKKVSDVLIDMKLPLIHKRSVKVLCSGEDIVWVIGVRIDDRYKISPATQSALYFKKRRTSV
jgi:tRNA(Ile)-lysidine synthase